VAEWPIKLSIKPSIKNVTFWLPPLSQIITPKSTYTVSDTHLSTVYMSTYYTEEKCIDLIYILKHKVFGAWRHTLLVALPLSRSVTSLNPLSPGAWHILYRRKWWATTTWSVTCTRVRRWATRRPYAATRRVRWRPTGWPSSKSTSPVRSVVDWY